jgi:hypothetical protein
MRTLILSLCLLSLAGCATSSPSGDIATYDTLKVARAECITKGAELVLVDQGDPKRISAYACKGKPLK